MTDLAIDPRDSTTGDALVQFPKSGNYLYRGKAGSPWLALPGPLANTALSSGLALDGASGTLYVTTYAGGGQLWRGRVKAAPVNEIQWELVYDFGPEVQAELLASGWSPEGLALYVNLTDRQVGRPVLHRSLDGGQSWARIDVEF